MKTALMDLNIILDMLTQRNEYKAAAAVFDHCVKRNLKGYVCSHEIAALAGGLGDTMKSRNSIIDGLLDHLSVLTAHERILRDALHSQIRDYHNAVLDELAFHAGVDFIVVRDLRGFEGAKNRVCTVREAVAVAEN